MTTQHTEHSPSPASPKGKTRKLLFSIFFVVIACSALSAGAYYFLVLSKHVTTDNAYVGAEIAQITPSTGGTIKEIHYNDTQSVKAGDVLVVIDDTDAKLALAKAQADMAKADAGLKRAKLDYVRRQLLGSSGAVSDEEVTTTENDMLAAQAIFDAAKVVADQAQVDLGRTIIKAPIDGVVSKRTVQLGQRVQAGSSLMFIVPMDKMHVDANFKEVQLKKVKIGQEVELSADLYGSDVIFHGKVSGISGGTGSAFAVIPAQNATGNWIKVVQRLPVRIDLLPEELAEHALQVGLSMDVDIHVAE
ncbi:MAG: efflux RND transporter periplasmic adaptor subunit [Pseudobdellovibrionaceae bacterium]